MKSSNRNSHTIGRTEGDEKSGNILLWKRKAEKFLIGLCRGTSMSYTIIHPGGLIDKPGGEREIVVGVDDKLLMEKVRNIPREDVATVCVEALTREEAKNRSFDIICRSPEETTNPTSDFGQRPVGGVGALIQTRALVGIVQLGRVP